MYSQLLMSQTLLFPRTLFYRRIVSCIGHLTCKSEVLVRYPVRPHTPYADSRGVVVSYWQKYVRKVLVNRIGGLSLPRESVVRLTDRPDMTLDVYRGRKTTTTQQQRQISHNSLDLFLIFIYVSTFVISNY